MDREEDFKKVYANYGTIRNQENLETGYNHVLENIFSSELMYFNCNARKSMEERFKKIRSELDLNNIDITTEDCSKLFIINVLINSKVRQMKEENDRLIKEIDKRFGTQKLKNNDLNQINNNSISTSNIPVNYSNTNNMVNHILPPKRKRRKRDEIERNYHCTYPNCDKGYG